MAASAAGAAAVSATLAGAALTSTTAGAALTSTTEGVFPPFAGAEAEVTGVAGTTEAGADFFVGAIFISVMCIYVFLSLNTFHVK
jgi:hypothetical protein